MIAGLKFLHVAAIALWAAGVIGLPGLYVQRASVRDKQALYRLQKSVRFAYVTIVSPAAFTAVASGIALSFAQDVFSGWFSMKLAFVAVLAMLHVLTGLVIIRLFNEGEVYPVWRFVLVTIISVFVVIAILTLVLAKPDIPLVLPEILSEPGGLKRIISDLSPWTIP
ncbi:CopD family protein [Peteryoungia desertarenae]|uniref:Protoporphyrinogen IX oxidase n=1 Tax=Peteryoungia desertarenae TaxID=1813451 RepID=A0ABX6QK50_9HYPH|nr:CopD family protein [Peteryoungia desertarenae]QLF68928.1 CopD family protein [Peteryoungia desertarenae]